jgi:hypothetical protein
MFREFLAVCDLSGKFDDVAALTAFQALVQADEKAPPRRQIWTDSASGHL